MSNCSPWYLARALRELPRKIGFRQLRRFARCCRIHCFSWVSWRTPGNTRLRVRSRPPLLGWARFSVNFGDRRGYLLLALGPRPLTSPVRLNVSDRRPGDSRSDFIFGRGSIMIDRAMLAPEAKSNAKLVPSREKCAPFSIRRCDRWRRALTCRARPPDFPAAVAHHANAMSGRGLGTMGGIEAGLLICASPRCACDCCCSCRPLAVGQNYHGQGARPLKAKS